MKDLQSRNSFQPYPDVTPLVLSGKRAIELIIESMEKVSERRTHEDKYIPGII